MNNYILKEFEKNAAGENVAKSLYNVLKAIARNPGKTALGVGGAVLVKKYGLPAYYLHAEQKKKTHNKINEALLKNIENSSKSTNELLIKGLKIDPTEPKRNTYNELITYWR